MASMGRNLLSRYGSEGKNDNVNRSPFCPVMQLLFDRRQTRVRQVVSGGPPSLPLLASCCSSRSTVVTTLLITIKPERDKTSAGPARFSGSRSFKGAGRGQNETVESLSGKISDSESVCAVSSLLIGAALSPPPSFDTGQTRTLLIRPWSNCRPVFFWPWSNGGAALHFDPSRHRVVIRLDQWPIQWSNSDGSTWPGPPDAGPSTPRCLLSH